MSDLFKFSYVRGAQNALVNSGAIGEYPTALAANTAVKIASHRLDVDPLSQAVTNDKLAEAMADIIQLGNGTLASIVKRANEGEVPPEVVQAALAEAADEAAAVEEAAVGGEVAPEAAAAVKDEVQKAVQELAVVSRQTSDAAMDLAAKMSTDLSAAAAVARLKAAADSVEGTGAADDLNNAEDAEEEGGERKSESYAQGLPQAQFDAAPGTGEAKAASSVNLDPKTAAAILRKLAAGEAVDATALNDVEDKENDGRPEGAYNTPPDAQFDAAPGTGSAKSASAAYTTLLAKTAEEVASKLPKALTSTDKLAAIRAMMGMTSQEKVAYIERINAAVKAAESDEESPEEEVSEDAADEGLEALLADAKAEEEAEEEDAEEAEKNSAAILRSLGIGN